mgnify:CR=1 FL=1
MIIVYTFDRGLFMTWTIYLQSGVSYAFLVQIGVSKVFHCPLISTASCQHSINDKTDDLHCYVDREEKADFSDSM